MKSKQTSAEREQNAAQDRRYLIFDAASRYQGGGIYTVVGMYRRGIDLPRLIAELYAEKEDAQAVFVFTTEYGEKAEDDRHVYILDTRLPSVDLLEIAKQSNVPVLPGSTRGQVRFVIDAGTHATERLMRQLISARLREISA